MIEVDIATIGSGISSLATLYIAKQYDRSAIAIDATYDDGGYLQIVDREVAISKMPISIELNDVAFFERLGIEITCLDVGVEIIKKGDYILKTLGFSNIEIQRNWFSNWINNTKFCTNVNIFNNLKQSLGFPLNKPIHITSNIRKIDVEKHYIALSTGELIKYKKLVYTWPLDILERQIYPIKEKNKIKDIIKTMNINYISIYTLLTLLPPKKELLNTAKIYIHASKASKLHTIIIINTKHHRAIYTITSYTKQNPLLPGIHEKLLSELKRHRIVTPTNILSKYSIPMTYGLINKIETSIKKELEQHLQNKDVCLLGRLSQWRELTVKQILEETNIS